MITVEFRDGSALVNMEGETDELCKEAVLIVNALYTALKQIDPMAGAYFEYKTRLDDSVWALREAARFEHIKMPIPDTGKGK